MAGLATPGTHPMKRIIGIFAGEIDDATHYDLGMNRPAPHIEDDEADAEARALAAAIAESDADPRGAPHEEVRAWLLRLTQGEFDAQPPKPR